MKEYTIKYKNRNYDLNDHKTSNNLNIIQNDEIERLTDFNESLLNDIDKLISKKIELETELDIVRSDNEQYRAIIIKLVKAINNTNFKDNLVRRSVSENTGKLNVKNRHYTELRNLLNDFTSKIPTKELMKIIEKEEAEDNKESA